MFFHSQFPRLILENGILPDDSCRTSKPLLLYAWEDRVLSTIGITIVAIGYLLKKHKTVRNERFL
jgi:hypothetical protein